MELRVLRYFLAVTREESISAACFPSNDGEERAFRMERILALFGKSIRCFQRQRESF